MELVGPVFEILKCGCAPMSRRFRYLRSFNENIENLRCKMEELLALENDLKIKLRTAEVNRRKKPKNEVKVWLRRVEKITTEVSNIELELKEDKKCLKGCSPNYCMHIKLSKLVEKKIKEVVELQEKIRSVDTVFADPLATTGMIMPTTIIVGKKTALKTFETIWECLMDTEIGTIGVYGMGGIGKTTIMTKINNRLIDNGDIFENIIWVTVSKFFNLEKLQNGIAAALELDLSNIEDEMIRAAKLLEKLVQKKFVLILDDMWDAFPLEKVGIPVPNAENGCKVILTTRSLDVCRRMESQRTIKVESLSREEAWELFKQKIRNPLKLAPEVKKIAKEVAEECDCLPLAIIVVGRAMREADDIREWRNALNELRSSTMEIEGMEDEVFGRLKFSYKRLRNEMVKDCFLYCALYPEDYKISSKQLVEYWIAEGLVEDLGNREAEIDKGYAIIKELENACVLEGIGIVDGVKHVKMHDLIRDMAIYITREGNRFIIKAGVSLKKFPEEEKWMEDVERISLMGNHIQGLCGQPNCPKLLTLFLQRNPLSCNISNSFFLQMCNLRVLDLSHTEIEYLPSLSELENLRALLLNNCVRLRKVPSLAKLKELRVLNLNETKIEELPQGMEEALNLRRIDLAKTQDLCLFPAGTLPKLSLLEDLIMLNCGWKWQSESSGGAGVEDIISLTQLSNLVIHLDLQGLISYVRSKHWKVLKSFHLVIGFVPTLLPSEWNYEVHINNIVYRETSLMFPDNTRYLRMENCITQLPELSNLKDLKFLWITECDGIGDCIDMEGESTLSTLETLQLRGLPSLRTISRRAIPCGALTSLKDLSIYKCNKVKNLLPLSLFQNLLNLNVITIWDCELMEEIAGGEAGQEEITFPKLRVLRLYNLPKLSNICRGIMICNSLQTLVVSSCPELKKLPLHVPHLKFLNISKCNFSKNLSSFGLSYNHQKLEAIEVKFCELTEEIFTGEEMSEASNSNIILPRLRRLELSHLPKLRRISNRELVCEFLHTIKVQVCPLLKELPFSLENLPPSLKEINGEKEWWDTLEWDNPKTKILLQPFTS